METPIKEKEMKSEQLSNFMKNFKINYNKMEQNEMNDFLNKSDEDD